MNTMELSPQNTEVEAPEEETIDYEAIRQELLEYQQKERKGSIPTAHLVDVNIGEVSNQELNFVARAQIAVKNIEGLYKKMKAGESYSEIEYWDVHDNLRMLDAEYRDTYRAHDHVDSGASRFYGYMGTLITIADSYHSLIERQIDKVALQRLDELKQYEFGRTASLQETTVSELIDTDLRAFRMLTHLESLENQLKDAGALEEARAYVGSSVDLASLPMSEELQTLVGEYQKASKRLAQLWEEWTNVELLSGSRYDFYNYIGNKLNVIQGHQQLAQRKSSE